MESVRERKGVYATIISVKLQAHPLIIPVLDIHKRATRIPLDTLFVLVVSKFADRLDPHCPQFAFCDQRPCAVAEERAGDTARCCRR